MPNYNISASGSSPFSGEVSSVRYSSPFVFFTSAQQLFIGHLAMDPFLTFTETENNATAEFNLQGGENFGVIQTGGYPGHYQYQTTVVANASVSPNFQFNRALSASDPASFTFTGVNGDLTVAVTNDEGGQVLASNFAAFSTPIVYSSAAAVTASPNGVVFGNDLGLVGATDGGVPTTILGGDGTNLLVSLSAGSEVIGGSGNDTVLALTGNGALIAAGAGNNLVQLGSGDAIVDSSGNDTVLGGSGTDVVDVNGGAQTLMAESGGFDVEILNTSSATIVGSGLETVTAATSGMLLFSQQGSTGTTFIDGAGAGASVTVNAGSAVETLYGASGASYTLIGSSANNVFVANAPETAGDGGDVAFNGSQASSGNQFWAGSGNATLIGGAGNDTLVAGQGAATMMGGAGTNDFDFFAIQGGSSTNVTITDFDQGGSSDVLKLSGYGSNTLQAINSIGSTTNGTMLTLNDGSTITLAGFENLNLSNADILFRPGAPRSTTT